ncbi:MAG TPA: hypothetical protein VJR89_30920, partial [Polyangiales bacterium]|nr:hypothetical protein [Polyangiales bacterium]
MKRTLTLRKKETVLTQLEGVLAVKHRAARASRARAGFPIDAWGTQVSPPHSVDSAVFLEAGWSFSQARDDLLLAARSGATIPDLSVRQVCLTQSGRMLMVGDRLTVQLRESTSTSRSPRRLAEDRLSIVRCLPFENVYEVRTVGAESALDAAQRLDPRYYDFAEPIFDEAIGQRWRPTDPDYGRQWQWHNTGAGGGRRGADVGIERAWDRTRGERADGTRVRISVIDNGMDVGHVDLEAAIVHGGHYEDDGTGSTSFVAYRRGGPFPDSNHGTFCAGIAA